MSLVAMLGCVLFAQDPAPATPGSAAESTQLTSAVDARRSLDCAVAWLLDTQNADGSWGTSTVESLWELEYSNASFYSWKLAGSAVAFLALSRVDVTPRTSDALERTLAWLLAAPAPRRGSDWDIDNNWATLYGFQAMVAAASDARFATPGRIEKIRERGVELYRLLEKNQDPLGGWGYYEGSVISRRPTWSTSFATASVTPALVRARELGWPVDRKVVDWAVRYLQKCRLPTGAYMYTLNPIPRVTGGEDIDDVKGSLSRIQVCQWALREATRGEIGDAALRAGLEAFFREHRFLFIARLKPIPHEAFYRNAGYFYYFGHCYAAEVINELPREEREQWHARLRTHVVRTQRKDGAFLDFVGSTYSTVASTAFAIIALQDGL